MRYVAGTAGGGAMDAIHLLTNQGIKTIEVEHDREPVFAFDTAQLRWSAGDLAPKTVWLVVDEPAVKPKSVRVLGNPRARAELKPASGSPYAIVITPPDTAGKFVVSVELDPPAEGQTAMVYAEVVR